MPPVPEYRREDPVFRTIIVPVDGSDHARKAVEIASRLAEPDGGRIVLVHVLENRLDDPELARMAEVEGIAPAPHRSGRSRVEATPVGPAALGLPRDNPELTRAQLDRIGQVILEQARNAAEAAGAPQVDVVMAEGDPAREIIGQAERAGADAIVVGSRGRSDIKGLIFGSVSHKVLHMAGCTCIAVR